ncbi:hypothetical protein Acr_00g0031060 [Actinidia rufa]|uniref:Polysaccharide biosynthesis domain-containing protein n=1 Tax=Actinidia rufa TaxID=165716 RepID=A0A7J0DEZ8_9ERIC|nr:hypothetical protein Acr_00g0031060 [Actinidia rufa]
MKSRYFLPEKAVDPRHRYGGTHRRRGAYLRLPPNRRKSDFLQNRTVQIRTPDRADPTPINHPLRHVSRGPAAIVRRDQRVLRSPSIACPLQLPHIRPRPRFAHVGLPQSTWHYALPRGGPQVVPDRPEGGTGSPSSQREVPDPALRGGPSSRIVPVRTRVFSKQILSPWQREVQVYDTEWDLIMIDAPKGYFAEAPGRMAAIYSASVMARNRKKSGVTHIFLHDVDRRVEKMFAEEFLCKKHLVKGLVGFGTLRFHPPLMSVRGVAVHGFAKISCAISGTGLYLFIIFDVY